MAIYEYKCPECGDRILTGVRGDTHEAWCDRCDGEVVHRRVFSLSIQRPMQEHWNQTVQAPVSSMHDFAEKLKVQGEAYSQRTGIDCNYQPVDMADRATLGVTDEGLDATRRRKHNEAV